MTDKVMDTNQEASYTNAERYFTVETARGYILINRKYVNMSILFSISLCIFICSFKDQSEGVDLLYLLGQINAWPSVLFDEVKYGK